jgi:dTDP-4-dehydrorhamnose reductase
MPSSPPKVLLTGLGGTVAPVVAAELARRGRTCIRWDKDRVPPVDAAACERFIDEVRPDWIAHIATGPEEWCTHIARACAARNINLIHTGSVSVYSGKQVGPFGVADTPEPDDDYGRYKLRCERRILEALPSAIIARIGWQIGESPGGNHMLDYLHRKAGESGGTIEASNQWSPGTSFLVDTGAALADLMDTNQPGVGGLYHVDGNPGLMFFEIATRLARLHRQPWTIVPAPTPTGSSRMTDPRVRVSSIADTLPV